MSECYAFKFLFDIHNTKIKSKSVNIQYSLINRFRVGCAVVLRISEVITFLQRCAYRFSVIFVTKWARLFWSKLHSLQLAILHKSTVQIGPSTSEGECWCDWQLLYTSQERERWAFPQTGKPRSRDRSRSKLLLSFGSIISKGKRPLGGSWEEIAQRKQVIKKTSALYNTEKCPLIKAPPFLPLYSLKGIDEFQHEHRW